MSTDQVKAPARRGRKLKGGERRRKYNISLHSAIVEAAKRIAESTGESFSGIIERSLQKTIKSS